MKRASLYVVLSGLLTASVVGLVLFEKSRSWEREIDQLVTRWLSEAESVPTEELELSVIETLPDPVRGYLRAVLPDEPGRIRFITLQQRGGIRTPPGADVWQALEARQTFATDPPGFVWNARVMMLPLTPVRVVDMYSGGTGRLRAKLFGVFTLAEESGRELGAGQLLRFLAEAVWFPTVLVPSQSLSWDPVDDRRAVARLKDAEHQVEMEFRFDERSLIVAGRADRDRRVDGGFEPTPWLTYYQDYREHEGFRIPFVGRVAWGLPGGEWAYWKGRLTRIEYQYERGRGTRHE